MNGKDDAEINEVMYVIDEHLEKLLHTQHVLIPALQRASKLIAGMDENKRIKTLDEFAEHSQWSAELNEQLEWVAHNQNVIEYIQLSSEEIFDADAAADELPTYHDLDEADKFTEANE